MVTELCASQRQCTQNTGTDSQRRAHQQRERHVTIEQQPQPGVDHFEQPRLLHHSPAQNAERRRQYATQARDAKGKILRFHLPNRMIGGQRFRAMPGAHGDCRAGS